MNVGTAPGVTWTISTFIFTRAITFLTTIVVARVLDPADFGVVALALLATALFGILSDLGLPSTLVVRQDLDRRAQGTVLCLMLVLGAALGGALAALSPLVAALFDEPRLAGVLAVLAATLLFNGLAAFYETVLLRELRFRTRFVTRLVHAVVGASTTLVLAFLGAGVWSLAFGPLVGALAHALALVVATPYRVIPRFNRSVARSAWSTSQSFFAQGGLAFLRQNVDYAAIGSLLGTAPLGFYSMAYRLSELPALAVAEPVAKVTFPTFARMRSRTVDLASPFLSTLRLVALVACPLGVMLSASSEPFTRALLGQQWLPLVGPLALLGLWGALRPIQLTLGWFLNATGHAGASARVSAAITAVLAPSVFIAARLGGVEAVASVMVGEAALTLLVFAVIAHHAGEASLSYQWNALKPVILACPASWLTGRLGAEISHGVLPIIGLTVSAISALAVYVIGLTLLAPGLLSEARDNTRHMLRRTPPLRPQV